MSIDIVAYLIGPSHLVAFLCAAQSLHPNQYLNITLIVNHPGISQEINDEQANICLELLSSFDYSVKIRAIPWGQISNLVSTNNLIKTSIEVKKILGDDIEFDEIYYGQDVTGLMYQILCTAYPNALKICFGDALGMVKERHVHLSLLGITVEKTEERFNPDKAALVLPIDESGNFLKNTSLIVCPKAIVQQILDKLILSSNNLQNYITKLIAEYKNYRKYLLLTENYSEANFIGFERETNMYCSIIKKYCEPDGVVFIKSHPGETLPRNDSIKRKLQHNFNVVELDKIFKRYPIEIWKDLVRNSTVLCDGFPSLSLKYLYGIDVLSGLDDNTIELWFPQRVWRALKNSRTLCREPLKRLENWNGMSVLYNGETLSK